MKRVLFIILASLILLISCANAAIIEAGLDEMLEKGEAKVIIIENDFGAIPKSSNAATSSGNAVSIQNLKDKNIKRLDIINGFAAKITKDELSELKDTKNIKAVYIDRVVEVKKPKSGTSAGISLSTATKLIGANYVWDNLDFTGRNVTVAVIDTGVDYTHDDLGNCTSVGVNCSKVIGGFDFVNNDADPMDDHEHGTHVAGIIAANGKLKGVAPNASILAIKALGSNGKGDTSDIIAGIDYAIANDADIISMSVGGTYQDYEANEPLRIASDNATNYAVVVIAAGNEGPGTSTIDNPGDADNVITVGASNGVSSIASFSSRGPAPFGRLDPDIVAPGVGINSTILNDGYDTFQGTSMAAPMISGAAALLLEKNMSLTNHDIKELLMTTADNINCKIFLQGAGVINITRAFEQKLTAKINNSEFWEFSVNDGGNLTAEITISNDYNKSLELSFFLDNPRDNEELYDISNNSFEIPDSFIIPPNTKRDMNINFTLPDNTSPSVYGTTLIIKSNESDSIRLLIVITKMIDVSSIINSSVDDSGNGINDNGDWIWYKIRTGSSKYLFWLEWKSTNDDFDIFLYNSSQELIGMSADANTKNESIKARIYSSNYLWVALNSYDITGLTDYSLIVKNVSDLKFLKEPQNITIAEDTNITLFINTTNPFGFGLTYQINDTSFISINKGGYLNVTPPPDWFGVIHLNITATDTIDYISSVIFVNITPVNDPPKINLSSLQNTIIAKNSINHTLNLSGLISDAETNISGLNLSCNSSNQNVAIDLDEEAKLYITPSQEFQGVSIIGCRVFDGDETASDSFSINITFINSPPVILTADNAIVNITDPVIINITASDDDNDTLIYSINSSLFSVYGHIFIWNTTLIDYGTYTFLINVSDRTDFSTKTVNVTVNDNRDSDGDGNPNYNDTDSDNDGINDTEDNLLGLSSNISSNLNISLLIDDSKNFLDNITGTHTVKVYGDDIQRLEFDYDFSKYPLKLFDVNVSQSSIDSRNFIIVKNLKIQGDKTIYLPKTTSYRSICLKDTAVNSESDISASCSDSSEKLLDCNGTQGSYNCTITNNTYRISGLKHSAIIEYGFCGDGLIQSGEICEGSDFSGKTCQSFGFDKGSLACNSCKISTNGCSNNPSGGSGGSSGFVIIEEEPTNESNSTMNNTISTKIAKEDTPVNSSSSTSKNSNNTEGYRSKFFDYIIEGKNSQDKEPKKILQNIKVGAILVPLLVIIGLVYGILVREKRRKI